MNLRQWAAAVALGAGAAAAGAAPYFSTDFNAGAPVSFSGGNLQGVGGLNGLGNGGHVYSGNLYRANGTITLSLNGLPVHSALDLGFLFAAIDSWDGPAGFNCCGPDIMTVRVDGNTVFSNSFNLFGHVAGDYNAPVGGQLSYGTNLIGTGWGDQAYDMYLEAAFQNIAHNSSNLTITWSSSALQGYDDESFALDNVELNLRGTNSQVPEPASLALLGLALAGAGVAGSRRRR